MIQNFIERIKQLVFGGIALKIAAIIGGAALITLLHGVFWGLIAPAWDTVWYIISHAGEIFKR